MGANGTSFGNDGFLTYDNGDGAKGGMYQFGANDGFSTPLMARNDPSVGNNKRMHHQSFDSDMFY